MTSNLEEKILEISPCINQHPILWFLFCAVLIIGTLGLAGLALLAAKTSPIDKGVI